MSTRFRFILTLMTTVMLLGLALATAAFAGPAPGATGYSTMVIPIMGNYTSTRTGLISWKAPMGYQIVGASATARASSGTSPTLKIRGKNAGFTTYSGSVTAGTVTDLSRVYTSGTASGVTVLIPPKVTAGSLQTIDVVIGGTSPKWSDVSILLFLRQY